MPPDPPSQQKRDEVPWSYLPAQVTGVLVTRAARYAGVDPDRVRGTDRHPPVVLARDLAMTAARRAGYSLTAIGRAFGRAHTTALNAARRTDAAAARDPALHNALDDLTQRARRATTGAFDTVHVAPLDTAGPARGRLELRRDATAFLLVERHPRRPGRELDRFAPRTRPSHMAAVIADYLRDTARGVAQPAAVSDVTYA